MFDIIRALSGVNAFKTIPELTNLKGMLIGLNQYQLSLQNAYVYLNETKKITLPVGTTELGMFSKISHKNQVNNSTSHSPKP